MFGAFCKRTRLSGLYIHSLFLMALLLTACAPISPVSHAPIVVATASPDAGSESSDVPIAWYKLLLQLAKSTPGFSPPVVSRAFGYAGVALYEAIAPGMSGYRSLTGLVNELPTMPPVEPGAAYHWPSVANSALATILRHLFPTITAEPLVAINKLEQKFEAQFAAELSPDVLARSQARGRAVADAVFEWSKSDGGHEGYLHNFSNEYVAPTGEGVWQPTQPRYAPALQPYWGETRLFVPDDSDACAPPPPPAYSTDPSSQFYQEAREVYDTVRNLTPEQQEIAKFWADDAGVTATPPGHSLSIATQVLQAEDASLALAAETYARLGMALADSFTSCWQTKFQYNVMRPITYIQQVIDPNWNREGITDPLITPPFPEYTSGHSVEAQAAATILTSLFGEHYRFTDLTHVDLGLAPRTFASFDEFADEAAISRLYGAIHYRTAIEQGQVQGACIGERIMALDLKQ
jgi:hypothetical protein